jgi:2-desacetyl-2-hydroxyethyl bacteriochlorophyllide A dehydrogenase
MAFVTEPGKIEFLERQLPVLGELDVLVRVKAVTLCGSDLHIFKGKHPSAQLPVPIGHEIAGQVQEVGAGVVKVKPGDKVAIEPVITCEKCHFCQRGQYHLCTDISFQYRVGQGGVAPFFVAAEKWVHPLPERISYAEGALLEPLSVALHAVKLAHIRVDESCAIFGAGAIGLMVAQLAKLAGCAELFIADINEFRLQKGLMWGATDALNSRAVDVIHEILNRTDGLGVDKAFEAVGLDSTLVSALKTLRKGGKAVVLGIFEKPEIRIPSNIFVQKEIALVGSQGYCWDFQSAIKLMDLGRVDLKGLITHQLPFENVQEAFEILMEPKKEAIKIVLTSDG